MAGTKTAGQMFDNTVIVKRGPAPIARLDYTGPFKANETLLPGSVCSLDENGLIVAGLSAGAAGIKPMPMFCTGNTDKDTDVNGQIGNFSGGNIGAVVATGGFEIETTEFVSATYAINEMLTVGSDANKAKVTKASDIYSTAPIVGIVSKKVRSNEFGKSVLRFWTVFYPGKNA